MMIDKNGIIRARRVIPVNDNGPLTLPSKPIEFNVTHVIEAATAVRGPLRELLSSDG